MGRLRAFSHHGLRLRLLHLQTKKTLKTIRHLYSRRYHMRLRSVDRDRHNDEMQDQLQYLTRAVRLLRRMVLTPHTEVSHASSTAAEQPPADDDSDDWGTWQRQKPPADDDDGWGTWRRES